MLASPVVVPLDQPHRPAADEVPRPDKWEGRGMTASERYEVEKRLWIATHPEATPAEYEASMRQLARKAGL